MRTNGFFDYDGLNKDIPVTSVLEYYTGQQVTWKKPVHCPNPNHNDKNPSCVAYQNTNVCKCFSCTEGSGTYRNLDIVMLQLGCSRKDAARHLISDFGLTGYQEIATPTEKREIPVDVRLLRLIGLNSSIKKKDDIDYSFPELYKESPKTFYSIVLGKLEETIRRYQMQVQNIEEYCDSLVSSLTPYEFDEMIKQTKAYQEFREVEVQEQKSCYDKEIQKERESHTDTKHPFKPSHSFQKQETKFPLTKDNYFLIEIGIEVNQCIEERIKAGNVLRYLEKENARLQKFYQKLTPNPLVGLWEEKVSFKKTLEESFEK